MTAAFAIGMGRYALGKAPDYAKDAPGLEGRPIGAHQAIAHPLAAGPHRARTGPADDAEGRRPLRRRRRHGRGRGRQHGQVRGRRGLREGRRPGRPHPRRQRPDPRVRPRLAGHGGPRRPDRAGQPGDDPQLRLPARPWACPSRTDPAGAAPTAGTSPHQMRGQVDEDRATVFHTSEYPTRRDPRPARSTSRARPGRRVRRPPALVDGVDGTAPLTLRPARRASPAGSPPGSPRRASARATSSPCTAPTRSLYPVVFYAATRAGATVTHRPSARHRRGVGQAAARLRRPLDRHRLAAAGPAARAAEWRAASRRSSSATRPRATARVHRHARLDRARAGGHDRPGRGRRGPAVLLGHDRHPQGRDAHPPQHRHQPRPARAR